MLSQTTVNLAPDYLLFVFVSALGAIQVAAAYSGLQGLLFLRNRKAAAMAGMALVVGSFVWFFTSGPRDIPDTAGGLNGNQQAAYFALGAGLAVAVTLALSSLLNFSLGQRTNGERGLDALRNITYIRALTGDIRRWWRRWQQWIRRYSSG